MENQLTHVRVTIPTTSEFLQQWHVWVHGKVAKHFKRDKERIPDTAQRVRLRLLTKDFVSRWFYKHLTDDVVDLPQACAMLGGVSVTNIGKLHPIQGKRSDPNSLWRISDILTYASFDYERYFYSVQNHTVDTNKVLRLLGCGTLDSAGKWSVDPDGYGVLESLYRQGRLKPSEFTEHDCTAKMESIPHSIGLCGVSGCDQKHYSRGYCSGHYHLSQKKTCDECDHGRESLNSRGISLRSRWSDPSIKSAISKLRWNDSQLTPFLRDWGNKNKIKDLPRYIMRDPAFATVDAGLLKYANMIIDNDVINHFKSLSRTDDAAIAETTEESDNVIQIKSDKKQEEEATPDHESQDIVVAERRRDVYGIILKAGLTEQERQIIMMADFEQSSIREVSEELGMTPSRVNGIRNSALNKMRSVALR
jgi:RNA polymerase sigma factor (sigma-70 family)